MTGCGHGMPTPASCWTCMEEGNLPPPPRPDPPRIVGTLRARWPTVCPSCGEDIAEGDEIAGVDHHDHVRWMHAKCAHEVAS